MIVNKLSVRSWADNLLRSDNLFEVFCHCQQTFCHVTMSGCDGGNWYVLYSVARLQLSFPRYTDLILPPVTLYRPMSSLCWPTNLTLCMLGNFACFFVVCGFFLKINFFKKHLSGIVRVSNSLDPDQARQKVGLDLGPKCLQRLSADYKSSHKRGTSQAKKELVPV